MSSRFTSKVNKQLDCWCTMHTWRRYQELQAINSAVAVALGGSITAVDEHFNFFSGNMKKEWAMASLLLALTGVIAQVSTITNLIIVF